MSSRGNPKAIDLVRAGLAIGPAGGQGSGKAPSLDAWKTYATRKPTLAELRAWAARKPRSWGVFTGAVSEAIVLDFDQAGLPLLKKWGLKPHVRTPSGGGHVYVAYPNSGAHISTKAPLDRERYPGLDVRGDGGFAVALGPGREWRRPLEWVPFEDLPAELRKPLLAATPASKAPKASKGSDRIREGERHQRLVRAAGWLAHEGYTEHTIAATLSALNDAACDPPQTAAEIKVIARSTREWAAGVRAEPPAPLKKAAFHGLAGEVVRAVEPHSEADPAALLATFLTAFGNAADAGPGFRVGARHHGVNLFVVIVGPTSSSRKGASLDGLRVVELADAEWGTKSGLSTGEGLIHHVRDEVVRTDGEEAIVRDPGVEDKRLFVVEAEFSRPLIVMARDGNTLSPVLRDAWDTGRLSTMTKTAPEKAANAHISLLAHITTDELRNKLARQDLASGFANRFLFVYARRSKFLPDGGELTDELLAPLAERVRSALERAGHIGDLKRADDAAELWRRAYPHLTTPPDGMVGAVIARAAPQVARLSVIYALLDEASAVMLPHLEAGLAVWRYASQSAAFIFRDSLGSPIAEKVLKQLRIAGDTGVTRSEINDTFGRHKHDTITAALEMLQQRGMATMEKEKTTGRPVERWWVT